MATPKVICYIILSYIITWLIWLPNVLAKQFGIGVHSDWLHILGGLGPLFGAILATFAFNKKEGVREFLKSRYRLANIRWLAVGIGMPIAFACVAYLAVRVVSSEWISLKDIGLNSKVPFSNIAVVWLIWLFSFGLGEESGWRGFLFPEIEKKTKALKAAVFVALIWAIWHLPVFFYDKDFMSMGLGGALMWLVSLGFGSMLLGWLVKQSSWTLWPAILWHGTFNLFTASDRVNFLFPAIISALAIATVFLIIRTYDRNFDKNQ